MLQVYKCVAGADPFEGCASMVALDMMSKNGRKAVARRGLRRDLKEFTSTTRTPPRSPGKELFEQVAWIGRRKLASDQIVS